MDVVSANPKTFTDLNEAINGNNDNDVYLDGNYTFQLGTDDNFKNGVVVGRAVTVWGNGYTLDGANAARIFTVTSFNVVFHDINFINGSATYYDLDYGGAIKGQCKAINCNFANNQAYFGGAMHLGTAYNCTFYNNRATGEGGAIHDAVAYNCTFSYNQAKSGGGAIYWGLARNCTFSYNQARFGGAIYDATAYGCTFYNNIAKGGGGAIYKNSAYDCTFYNNRASGDGGAMYGNGHKAENCIFTNNTANSGGAAYQIIANNCTFTQNKAKYDGGAMYEGSAIICIFKDNKAESHGDDTYKTDFPKSVLSVSNFTSTYNSGDRLLFNFNTALGTPINNANITIRVYKNNTLVGTYYALSGDGWVVKLDVGSYIAVCSVENQIYDVDPVNATLKIAYSVNLTASYKVRVLNDGFAVNIVVNADFDINDKITIKFNGKQYKVEMINGTANFISNKVYSKTYPTNIVYAGSENYTSSTSDINVVVKATKVSRVNTFTYYYYNNDMGSDSQKGISQIKVVDIDGNPIKNGLVTLTIMNKYKLKVKTDAKGVAKFTKAYKPGTYKVTATYDNKVTNLGNLVLKSVVNVPKVTTVKKSTKTTTLKITLKGTGPIKGKTVQVSFMKKNYYVKTDSKGVAQFKVTQDMVSKLAVGKTYKIRVTYRMDSVAQGIQILK